MYWCFPNKERKIRLAKTGAIRTRFIVAIFINNNKSNNARIIIIIFFFKDNPVKFLITITLGRGPNSNLQ